MHGKLRMILFVVTSIVAAGTVVWMQRRFESADAHAGLEIVQGYRSSANATVPELLVYHHPNATPEWSTKMQSACFQHIRVEAQVTDPPGGTTTSYVFDVDINGPVIHPANDSGRKIIAELDEPPSDLHEKLAELAKARAAAIAASASASAAPSTSAAPSASAAPEAAGGGAP